MSKAAIRSQYQTCKTPEHRLQAQIFYEKVKMRRNTVNGYFPGGSNGPPKPSGKCSIVSPRQLD
jgi:hypothetical protein